ncbi:hypothetical protein ACFPOE_09695 [Caenimonas terrae]|uniref:Uncharacterized protein n=1 Tax=Caenimonas terrae TaxID=696074 RepID=A0ABW0NCU1_9BURK
MFAGHVGAALALGRAQRRVNVGVFVLAALLLDAVLWVLVLLGWESVAIAPDYASTHQPQFDFPFSHWLLDALVHRPELPLAGDASARLGLGLWNAMPLALAVEAAIALAGLALFLSGAGLSRGRKLALALVLLVVLAGTVAGMTVAPPPPSIAAMAWSSLGAIALVCLLAGWFGRGAMDPGPGPG